MLQVLGCITVDHDLRLVAIAALLCATASAAAFGCQIRSQRARGLTRWVWVGLTALVAGSGVWATHFTGMLAYEPQVPVGYALAPTVGSLVTSILGMGAGFALATIAGRGPVVLASGGLTGMAVAAMHYLGVSGLRAPARLEWDYGFVVASVVIAALGGAAAFGLRARLRGPNAWRLPGLVLCLTIVALHFTGMTAMTLVADPTQVVPQELMGRGTTLTATMALAILVLAVAGALSWMERVSQRSTLTTLRHALNAVPSGLAFFDSSARLLAWNTPFAAIMSVAGVELRRGVLRQEIVQQVRAAGWFEKLDETQLARFGLWDATHGLEMQLPDRRWLRHEVFRTDEGGGVTALTDITEHKESARAMAQARDAAEAASRAKSVFLANMSHEIRTPLNGVLGVAEVLRTTGLTPRQTELVEVIQHSGQHLHALLGDLLDIAKVEAGVVEIRPEPVELGSLAAEVRDLFTSQATGKGLDLRLELSAQASGWTACDPLRIRQVLTNLVSNAVKFTERGEVVISLARTGDAVRFTVRDTGCGFDDDRKAALFARFVQGDESSTRQHGGAGLGLALCQTYVRLMGGELEAVGRPGEGATFQFTLDLPAIDPPDAEAPPSLAGVQRWSRVLIVDDNPVNRQVLAMILDAVGVEYGEAENGRLGVEAARTGAYDAVLMDIQMPVMDGFEATRLIRDWEREQARRRMPIIIVSANCLQEHIEAGVAAGADAHLSKPVSVPQLVGALEQHTAALAA